MLWMKCDQLCQLQEDHGVVNMNIENLLRKLGVLFNIDSSVLEFFFIENLPVYRFGLVKYRLDFLENIQLLVHLLQEEASSLFLDLRIEVGLVVFVERIELVFIQPEFEERLQKLARESDRRVQLLQPVALSLLTALPVIQQLLELVTHQLIWRRSSLGGLNIVHRNHTELFTDLPLLN